MRVKILNILTKMIIPTPIGDLIGIASANGLFILTFKEEQDFIDAKIERFYKNPVFLDNHLKTLEITNIWLKSYFSNQNPTFQNPPLPPFDLQGSDFSKKTWCALSLVPYGTTQSYGELAIEVSCYKAHRAIGKTVGNNPIAIIIPCHRILGANGSLTGFRSGLERKKWLLKHENLKYKI